MLFELELRLVIWVEVNNEYLSIHILVYQEYLFLKSVHMQQQCLNLYSYFEEIYFLQNYLASAGRSLVGSSGSRLVPGVASRLVHLAGSPIVRETAPLLCTLIWILSASELLVS